ncbi:hypothetical protein R3P38DRAFT_3283529 [Favolaschia claudopus]|uniref:Uncharacterized protein n=1 Tax=Favolaschia claudopus TaxID=2862362 RepID=A0AAW0A6A9_9AGAR
MEPPYPPPTKFNNCCPDCGSYLVPKLTKDGDHWHISVGVVHYTSRLGPNSLLQCYKPAAHAQTYHHRWPPLPRPTMTTTPALPAISALPATFPASISAPPPTASQPTPKCSFLGCSVTRMNRNCTNRMCKKHCIKAGGCAYSLHSGSDSNSSITIPAQPRSLPFSAPSVPRQAAPHLATSTSSAFSVSSHLSSRTAPPLRMPSVPSAASSNNHPFSALISSLEKEAEDRRQAEQARLRALAQPRYQQDARARQLDRQLDGLYGVNPTSPERTVEEELEEELARQEAADLQEAIRLSERDTARAARHAESEAAATAVTRPSPPPVASTSTLRPLSLSPSPPPPASLLPVMHTQPAVAPPPLKITKQLGNDWVNPSPVFNVAAAKRRPQPNLELARKFILVFLHDLPSAHRSLCQLHRPSMLATIPAKRLSAHLADDTADGDDNDGSRTPTPSTPTPSKCAPGDRGSWMKGKYVCDMVEVFVMMDRPSMAHLSKRVRFHRVFGEGHFYAASTYDDQYRRWRAATPAQQKAALDAGRTEEGLWSVFGKQHSLRR